MILRKGIPVSFHCDGDNRKFFPRMIEMGIQCIQAIDPCGGRQDIFELKRLYGARVALHGNIDCELLISGTPDDVRAATEEQVRILAPGGRLHLLVQPRSERTDAHGEHPGDDRDDPRRQSPDRRPTMSSPRIRVMERYLVAGGEVGVEIRCSTRCGCMTLAAMKTCPCIEPTASEDRRTSWSVRRWPQVSLRPAFVRRGFGAREASIHWTDW